MLNIFYGDMKEAVYNTATYFNIRILNTNQVGADRREICLMEECDEEKR